MLPALAALGSGAATGARALGGAAGTAGAAGSLYPPVTRYISQSANKSWTNEIPSPAELIGLRRYGNIDESTFLDRMSEHGFDPVWCKRLFDAGQTLLAPVEYILLWRKGAITEDTLKDRLGKSGFNPEEITLAIKSTEYFPPPDDLIRMAVRDVWSENKAVLGLGSTPPAKFLEEAGKSGLGREWAQLYWDAHWELPSLTAAFVMFHRGIIKDVSEVKALIQAHDYNPIWHEKLLGLSYHLPTRVDVRRIYDLGLQDRTWVLDQYKKMGYSPDDAEALTQFTEKSYDDEANGLSRAAILRSYTQGLIDAVKATELLTKLDLGPEVVSFYLAQADFEKQNVELQDRVKELTAQWQLGAIDIAGIRNALAADNAPASFIEQTVARIERQASAKIKLPTRSDLERWFKKQMIGEEAYFAGMVKLGYTREDSRLFMQEILHDNENPTVKYLSQTVYARWIKNGILSPDEWRKIGAAMKLLPADIERTIQENINAAPNS